MGQSASKAASRAAQRTAAAAAAASKPRQTPSAVGPPPPESNISASTAAVEASAKVRPPTFETPASPQDLAQQQVLRQQQQQQGSSSKDETTTMQEMPDDLLQFLNDAGPLHKQERPTTKQQRSREPRMPRQPWQQTSGEASSSSERRQEPMPLAEKIEGFEVSKSTSFSRSTPEINPKIYQKGTTLDMYHFLSQKDKMASDDESLSRLVAQTYQTYGSEFALPEDKQEQEKHKQLLASTLKYLDLPVIMKDYHDNQDSYDGIHPDQVDVYQTMKLQVMPKDKVRLVLEDLHEIEKGSSS